MKQKMLPKWQTDPVWALRRARRKKQRLPEDVEKLFLGNPDYCRTYVVEALKSSLPDFLVNSVCDHFKAELESKYNNTARLSSTQKEISNWILTYVINGGKLNEKLKRLFIEAAFNHMNTHYDWGRSRCIKLAEILGNDTFPELEDLIWNHSQCAFVYSKISKKRIPAEFEEQRLLESDDEEFIDYVKLIFKGRATKDVEALLLKKPSAACKYAEFVAHGKLPEAIHSSLIMQTFGNTDDDTKQSISDYLDFVKQTKIYTANVLAEFDKNDTVENVLKKLKE